MPAVSFSLSDAAIAYIAKQAGETNNSKSAALEEILQEHRLLNPRIARQKSLEELRSAAANLKELGNPPDAILSWVRVIVEQQGVSDEKQV